MGIYIPIGIAFFLIVWQMAIDAQNNELRTPGQYYIAVFILVVLQLPFVVLVQL